MSCIFGGSAVLRSSSFIIDYFKKHWFRYISGLIIVILSTYLGTLIPRYLGQAIDGLNSGPIDLDHVKSIAVSMVIIAIAAFVSRFVWRYMILGFCRQIEFYLREHLFRHLQILSVDYYVKNNTGDLITRAIVDVQAVRIMLGFAIVALIDTVVTLLMSIINMSAVTNATVTLIAAAPIPLLIFVIIKVRLTVRSRYTKVQEAISDISSKVHENITGIRVMKAFSQEDKESAAFSELSKAKLNAEIKLARAYAVISPSVGLTFGIVFSVFLVVGGSMVAQHTITLGDYVSFNTYLLLIMAPIGNVGRIVDRWQRGIASMKRLDSIFAARPSVDDSKADLSVSKLETGDILVKNLCFAYDASGNILNDLSFHVPSGGSLVVMGPTGSGKTTIIGLLPRVWNCGDGMIFIDGKNVSGIPLKVLRESCVYVPQDTFLFSDTIMENIRFCDKSVTDEQVVAAAEAASVHDNIMEFPKGYQTVVGERGMTLSGGQKQRIALARALARRPKILLLDDCMSAVDSLTEKKIIESLKTQKTECTTIIVTHRLSVASLADTVLILDSNGSIAQIGSHSKLMEQGGVYVKMIESMQAEDTLGQEDGDIRE
jgi:ATP-binding cassette, subfamily B, multidrug efflux pump